MGEAGQSRGGMQCRQRKNRTRKKKSGIAGRVDVKLADLRIVLS